MSRCRTCQARERFIDGDVKNETMADRQTDIYCIKQTNVFAGKCVVTSDLSWLWIVIKSGKVVGFFLFDDSPWLR